MHIRLIVVCYNKQQQTQNYALLIQVLNEVAKILTGASLSETLHAKNPNLYSHNTSQEIHIN